MPVDDIIKLMIVSSLVVLPAVGLTVRFALKPIVEAILRLKEGGVLAPDSSAVLVAEIRQMRAELRQSADDVAQVRQEMTRLQEAESFNLALRDSASAPLSLPK
ncbi:MAG TPA: hypothetical protein VEX86_00890 [Longimicrobium sp.]|nr:hypothetical protein [Longimicrobium sp.]